MIDCAKSLELLTALVRANRDVEAAFIVCADVIDSEPLRVRLLAQARVCAAAGRELTGLVSARGGAVSDDGTWTESAPDWIALRSALVDRNEAAVLDECAHAEDQLVARFRDVLEHPLSRDIRRAVAIHFAALIQNRGRLRELRLPALLRDQPVTRPYRLRETRSVRSTHLM
jgi:uncharacterized protein (TIGR02284 family)